MTRDEAITLLKSRLGNPSRSDMDSYIQTELELAQKRLERSSEEKPWFLLSEESTVSCTVGEDRLPIPTDFLAEFEDGALWLYDSTADTPYAGLKKYAVDEIRNMYPGPGKPEAYAVAGDYFRLAYVPDDTYTIKFVYYAADTVLDTNIENKWLKHYPDLLIAVVGKTIALHLQNKPAADIFASEARESYAQLLVDNERRREDNRESHMGDED